MSKTDIPQSFLKFELSSVGLAADSDQRVVYGNNIITVRI